MKTNQLCAASFNSGTNCALMLSFKLRLLLHYKTLRGYKDFSKSATSRVASNQQVESAGEYFVVGELNNRGAFAVPIAGKMPMIDIIACNSDESSTVYIQVKTKRGEKTWHATIGGSQPISSKTDETNF